VVRPKKKELVREEGNLLQTATLHNNGRKSNSVIRKPLLDISQKKKKRPERKGKSKGGVCVGSLR